MKMNAESSSGSAETPNRSVSRLKGANIVVLARNHNPAIVSREWVINKNIIKESIDTFIHTPVFSVIESNSFSLHVNPDRMQVGVKRVGDETLRELPEIVKKYVSNLPETPYTAVVFNFHYEVLSERRIKDILTPSEKFKEVFQGRYEVGGIIRFGFEPFTVTLRMPPEESSASFNFHADVRSSEEVLNVLEYYHRAREKAENVLEGLFE